MVAVKVTKTKPFFLLILHACEEQVHNSFNYHFYVDDSWIFLPGRSFLPKTPPLPTASPYPIA